MKLVSKKKTAEKQHTNFVEREISLLRSCRPSPYIVKLECSFRDAQNYCFVLEFMPGGELFYHLKKNKVFGERRAKFYAAQIVLALEYLHNKGIIYRDLKPENILLDADGYIKLCDLGLAKQVDFTETFCGTSEYLAPEQVRRGGYNKDIDWWMLVGQL